MSRTLTLDGMSEPMTASYTSSATEAVPPLRQPGDTAGPITATSTARGAPLIAGEVPLIAVGSHDTASAAAAGLPALRFVVDADDPVFLPPGDMAVLALPARPATPAETVRSILDSPALAYRRALLATQSLSGRHADAVHVVGGGSRDYEPDGDGRDWAAAARRTGHV